MAMQPWFGSSAVSSDVLRRAVKVLNISRSDSKRLNSLIDDYELFGGQLVWTTAQLPELGKIVKMILGLNDTDIARTGSSDKLTELVKSKLNRMKDKHINDICFVITAVEEVDSNDV